MTFANFLLHSLTGLEWKLALGLKIKHADILNKVKSFWQHLRDAGTQLSKKNNNKDSLFRHLNEKMLYSNIL